MEIYPKQIVLFTVVAGRHRNTKLFMDQLRKRLNKFKTDYCFTLEFTQDGKPHIHVLLETHLKHREMLKQVLLKGCNHHIKECIKGTQEQIRKDVLEYIFKESTFLNGQRKFYIYNDYNFTEWYKNNISTYIEKYCLYKQSESTDNTAQPEGVGEAVSNWYQPMEQSYSNKIENLKEAFGNFDIKFKDNINVQEYYKDYKEIITNIENFFSKYSIDNGSLQDSEEMG